MREWLAVVSLLCALGATACSRGSASRNPSDGDGGGGSGAGRLGWDQAVDGPADVASFRFRLWVDDRPDDMLGVTCGAPVNLIAPCSGALRAMTPGPHTVALSVISRDVESPRSQPITVLVGANGTVASLERSGSVALLDAQQVGERPAASAGVVDPSVSVEHLADGLSDPTDVAVTPTGRVVVAERGGTVREWRASGLSPQPLLSLDDVDVGAGGLLGLAVDVDHPRNRFVFVAYTAATGFRVARYRLVEDSLGEGAVLFETLLDTRLTAAAIQTGADGLVYVGLDDGGDERQGGDLGSYGGKLLRLDRNGGIPDTQSGRGPIYVTDLRAPTALTWNPRDRRLWIADAGQGAGGVLTELRELPAGEAGVGRFATVTRRLALPDRDDPTVAQFYEGAVMNGWGGSLLLGLRRTGALWRIAFDTSSPQAEGAAVRSTHVVLDGTLGPIGGIAVEQSGVVYLTAGGSLLRLTRAQ